MPLPPRLVPGDDRLLETTDVQFALAIPWWAIALLLAAAVAVSWACYTRLLVPLSSARRSVLVTLRATALALLMACLLRPVRVTPPDSAVDAVVPVLIDVSRSMALGDGEGRQRVEAAQAIVDQLVKPSLAGRFAAEVWHFGESVRRATDAPPVAADTRTDLAGALRSVREQYRDRRIAGLVVVSDGVDTGTEDATRAVDDGTMRVYAVGVGQRQIESDLEVLDISAGEARLADSAVDLTVTVTNRGTGPLDVRLLQNGMPIDVRRVTPEAPGSPTQTVFTVEPSRETPSVYTAEIPSAPGEPILENNRRSLVVEPPGRRRRVLVVEGAPGFEHAFIKRALAADPGIELDSIVRKGWNVDGDPTYVVQAASDRAPLLASGFPTSAEALFQYDAIILANIELGTLPEARLKLASDFVAVRGGGLLVLGAKSFAQRGLMGTPIEDVLPVRLTGGADGGLALASSQGADGTTVSLTGESAVHPVMRLGASRDETIRRWRALPSLAGAATLGAARPGAQVLASVRAAGGSRPLVVVQRYGRGRSMVFAGEASWRWRMQMASTDRTFELFWRHVARWLAADAPDQTLVTIPAAVAPGETAMVRVEVRDTTHAPVLDAALELSVVAPDGARQTFRPALTEAGAGEYAVAVPFGARGLHEISVAGNAGSAIVQPARRSVLVGGIDREMADPRLNEALLQRVARASGGQYLPSAEAGRIGGLLATAELSPGAPRVQELWHHVLVFLAIVMLLAAEWTLRRRWGMR